MTDKDDYEIGYRKPPKHTRFRKGQSGNPEGRPKGSKNLRTILAEIGRRKVEVKPKDGVRWMTTIEASSTQLANQAMSGKLPAIREYLQWQKFSEEDIAGAQIRNDPDENDRAVMQSIVKRIRRANEKLLTDPNEDEKKG